MGFNAAAEFQPWIVLVDLNGEFECAPALVKFWLPRPAKHMRLRVAVRSIEAWLMADLENLATFMGVSRDSIPSRPDSIQDPKLKLVSLARRSRFKDIRFDLVPSAESRRIVGPAYSSRLTKFVLERWDPQNAKRRSPSLRATADRLAEGFDL